MMERLVEAVAWPHVHVHYPKMRRHYFGKCDISKLIVGILRRVLRNIK